VTTSLSMMSVVLSGWTPEPGWGSDRVAEMTGQALVMTDLGAQWCGTPEGAAGSALVAKEGWNR
jgi:hypothetical protein